MPTTTLLTDSLLARCRGRAPTYVMAIACFDLTDSMMRSRIRPQLEKAATDWSAGVAHPEKNELERLYRDARAGRFHPANPALTHELLGKLALGISPDERPRWG